MPQKAECCGKIIEVDGYDECPECGARLWVHKCRGCDKEFDGVVTYPPSRGAWAREDHNGIFTGVYCYECYDSNDPKRYPYRKDDYTADAEANGECVEPEDY